MSVVTKAIGSMSTATQVDNLRIFTTESLIFCQSIHVGCVVVKVALGQFFLRVPVFSFINYHSTKVQYSIICHSEDAGPIRRRSSTET
jgi:hypothetical protein